ncbi:MAG: GspH/FimT family pseudopilin [Planctomycetota bacterium]
MPRNAFTLIELTIVLLLLGVLAGVAAPKYADAVAHFRVEAAARRIAADLKHARAQAMAAAAERKVVFDAAADEYLLDGVVDLDHSSQIYRVSLADAEYLTDILEADFAGGSEVVFSHRGAALAAGAVKLHSGGHTRSVEVSLPHSITIVNVND